MDCLCGRTWSAVVLFLPLASADSSVEVSRSWCARCLLVMRSEAAAGAVALPYLGGNFSEVDNANGVRTSEKTLVRVDLYITANIGRYVVSILHDRPLCSFDILGIKSMTGP